ALRAARTADPARGGGPAGRRALRPSGAHRRRRRVRPRIAVPRARDRQGLHRVRRGRHGLPTLMTAADRYSYGPYHDGPDPLAPPVDLRAALDMIGEEVMSGSSPRSALEELLRRGTKGMRGLEDLTRRLWQRRAAITRDHRLDGTLRRVRELLDEALEAERRALFPDPSDDARFAEAQLDALPSSTAAAVGELAEYGWRSETGRQNYRQIRGLLGRDLLESRFQSMKQALRDATPRDLERVRRM